MSLTEPACHLLAMGTARLQAVAVPVAATPGAFLVCRGFRDSLRSTVQLFQFRTLDLLLYQSFDFARPA